MESGGGRLVGGRGGSLVGRMLPQSLAGKLALAALCCWLLWMEPDLWVLPAALLLGAVMCVFRVRGQPVGEAMVAGVGGPVLFQLAGPVVTMLALALALALSSLWETPVLRLFRKRGWLGKVRMRELREESDGAGDRAGGRTDPDRPLRLLEVSGKFRWFGLGLAAGSAAVMAVWLLLMVVLPLNPFRTPARNQPSRGTDLRPPPVPAAQSVSGLEWELRDLDGREAPLSSFAGEVLFVNRWATWCPPCIEEMPAIGRLMEQVPPEDVAYLLVSDEAPAVVREFVRKRGWELPVYVYTGREPAPFRGSSIPVSFIVDRKGGIVFRHVGAAAWDDPAAVRFLTGLLDD